MRMSVLRCAAVAVGAVGIVVALATPSDATAPRPKVFSSYLAGYQTTQVGISRASASVVMPAVTCDPTQTQGVAFGIGNEPSPGQLSLLAGVRIVCSGGSTQQYGYAFGTATHQVQLASGVAPGDHFSILLQQTETKLIATATDTTTNAVYRVSGTPVPDNTLTFGAFPIESGVTPLPVPDFGVVTIIHPVLENTLLSAWSPTKLTRRTGLTTQISSGAFLPNGNFRVNYVSS